MPLKTFNHPRLELTLPDLSEGVKRFAVNCRLIYDIDTKFINIKWIEKRFTNDYIFIGQEEKVLTAKSTKYIDITDGSELCNVNDEYMTTDGEPDGEGNPTTVQSLNPALVNKNYAIECDYYDHIAYAVPIVVNDIIKLRILKQYELI